MPSSQTIKLGPQVTGWETLLTGVVGPTVDGASVVAHIGWRSSSFSEHSATPLHSCDRSMHVPLLHANCPSEQPQSFSSVSQSTTPSHRFSGFRQLQSPHVN